MFVFGGFGVLVLDEMVDFVDDDVVVMNSCFVFPHLTFGHSVYSPKSTTPYLFLLLSSR